MLGCGGLRSVSGFCLLGSDSGEASASSSNLLLRSNLRVTLDKTWEKNVDSHSTELPNAAFVAVVEHKRRRIVEQKSPPMPFSTQWQLIHFSLMRGNITVA